MEWKHGGMWCVNSEMLCLPFMTVVLLCLYLFLYIVLFLGCEWVGGHVGGGGGGGGGAGKKERKKKKEEEEKGGGGVE